jgi:hypothetical protein
LKVTVAVPVAKQAALGDFDLLSREPADTGGVTNLQVGSRISTSSGRAPKMRSPPQ